MFVEDSFSPSAACANSNFRILPSACRSKALDDTPSLAKPIVVVDSSDIKSPFDSIVAGPVDCVATASTAFVDGSVVGEPTLSKLNINVSQLSGSTLAVVLDADGSLDTAEFSLSNCFCGVTKNGFDPTLLTLCSAFESSSSVTQLDHHTRWHSTTESLAKSDKPGGFGVSSDVTGRTATCLSSWCRNGFVPERTAGDDSNSFESLDCSLIRVGEKENEGRSLLALSADDEPGVENCLLGRGTATVVVLTTVGDGLLLLLPVQLGSSA